MVLTAPSWSVCSQFQFDFPSFFHTQSKHISGDNDTYFDTPNSLCPFVLGQKPGICGGVREQETAYSWIGEGWRDARGAHKNMIAVMRVSVPVTIISLGKGKCYGEMLSPVVPLPWLKSSCMYVQGAKTDKTNDNLSYSVHKCLSEQGDSAFEPVPFIKSVGGWGRLGEMINRGPYTNNQHEPFALSAYKTWNWQSRSPLWWNLHTFRGWDERRRDRRSSCKLHGNIK